MAEQALPAGTATGVDVSRQRLAACRTVVMRYALPNVRIYLEDGTTFARGPPCEKKNGGDGRVSEGGVPAAKRPRRASRRLPRKDRMHCVGDMFYAAKPLLAAWTEAEQEGGEEEEVAAGTAAGENQDADDEAASSSDKKPLPQASTESHTSSTLLPPVHNHTTAIATAPGYDRVLVDAECTHDGSLRHICKFESWGWETLPQRMLDADRLAALGELQRGLLLNGARRLRLGGRLVYSTCSLTTGQNEEVVRWFLQATPEGRAMALVPTGLPAKAPCVAPNAEQYPELHYCARVGAEKRVGQKVGLT
jgi:hypothetical protein